MAEGKITVFTGEGRGKTSAALGMALQGAVRGENVVIIQFLKGRGLEDSEYLHRLEPEIKLFRFEKCDAGDSERTPEQREEEIENIRNGLHFARKVLMTGECDILVLDEILGVVDNQFISVAELKELMSFRDETKVILTGVTLIDEVCSFADEITEMKTVQFKKY